MTSPEDVPDLAVEGDAIVRTLIRAALLTEDADLRPQFEAAAQARHAGMPVPHEDRLINLAEKTIDLLGNR